jgi:quinoprotein glucose dehydrogenase
MATICPVCGADLQDFSSKSYEEKLIIALQHPEPTVPIRAATILGELRSNAAVEPLIDVAISVDDPYIQEAAVVALGRIGDVRAISCLDLLSREGAVRVRAAAERTLKNLRDRRDATRR